MYWRAGTLAGGQRTCPFARLAARKRGASRAQRAGLARARRPGRAGRGGLPCVAGAAAAAAAQLGGALAGGRSPRRHGGRWCMAGWGVSVGVGVGGV